MDPVCSAGRETGSFAIGTTALRPSESFQHLLVFLHYGVRRVLSVHGSARSVPGSTLLASVCLHGDCSLRQAESGVGSRVSLTLPYSLSVRSLAQLDFLWRLRVSSRGPTASPRVRRRRVFVCVQSTVVLEDQMGRRMVQRWLCNRPGPGEDSQVTSNASAWGSQVCMVHFEGDVFQRTSVSRGLTFCFFAGLWRRLWRCRVCDSLLCSGKHLSNVSQRLSCC